MAMQRTIETAGVGGDGRTARAAIEALAFRLGLLAGLGPAARGHAGALAARMPAGSAPELRTCIHAGTPVLLTVHAPGPVAIATSEPLAAADHTRLWHRTALAAHAPVDAARSLIFDRPTPNAPMLLGRVLGIAANRPDDCPARRLDARGPIYMGTRADPGTESDWLAWQIDRPDTPQAALAAIDRPEVWPAAQALLSELVDRRVGARMRPWTIALPLNGPAAAEGRLRFGGTLWSRIPEDPAKIARFARQIARFGGDPRLAEATYRLAAPQTLGHGPRGAVGVAAEYDFTGATPVAAHFTLRAALPAPADPRTAKPGAAQAQNV